MDVSDEDIQRFLEADPAVDAARQLPAVFGELCKHLERGEAFDLLRDYWNWLLDGLDAISVVDDGDD